MLPCTLSPPAVGNSHMSESAEVVPIRPSIRLDTDALTLADIRLFHEGRNLLDGVTAEISSKGITTSSPADGSCRTTRITPAS